MSFYGVANMILMGCSLASLAPTGLGFRVSGLFTFLSLYMCRVSCENAPERVDRKRRR